ncbi:hypothetical protein Q5P01_022720 [Channa striata]|uniref:TGF-beta family profile domain-containing protein n=1 Tax=Channa striata TaxID=64152 RepID=A0AA88S796_CHASR|nr:hypothetical protein Q5P01_022720 [Channa striata]
MLFPRSHTSFNAPPRSKMKLWKSATFAFVLCGAALSILLVRNMATVGQFRRETKYPHASSSSSRTSSSSQSTSSTSPPTPTRSSSSAETPVLSRLHRRIRAADNMNALLSEFSVMLQSFTEGELQHVVETLLDRKRRKNQGRRTKRAQMPKPCSLRKLEVTVRDLKLGYESDETVLLRYCSGECTAHRHNYDIAVAHVMRTRFRKKGRKVSNGPCCRPTAFEKGFSFLDNNSRYHTIQNVSAKHCGCV